MSGGDVNYICIKSCASLVFFSIDTELSEHVDAVFFSRKTFTLNFEFLQFDFSSSVVKIFKFNSIPFAK